MLILQIVCFASHIQLFVRYIKSLNLQIEAFCALKN